MQVAPAYGELPVARDEEEIAPEISRASEWLDDVGVCESASSSPHWPRKAIHEGTVLSDSVHDITDQNSAATSDIVVISTGQAPVVLVKAQALELPLAAKAEWSRRRGTGSLLACFLLIALAGAMPRSIALVIIERTVQLQSPMPAAFENFAAIWAPCKDPENTFTAFYQEGQLYRTIILTDHVFWLVGITLAYLGAIHVVFPVMPPDALPRGPRGRTGHLFSLCHSALCVLGVVSFAVFMGMDAALYHPKMTKNDMETSHLLVDYFLYTTSCLFLLSYVVLSATHSARLRATDPTSNMKWGGRLIFNTLLCLLMAMSFFFVLWIGGSSGLRSLHSLLNFTGGGAAVGKIIIIMGISKVLLLLMRRIAFLFVDLTDNTTCQAINIFTFVVTFSISISIRLNSQLAMHYSSLKGAPEPDEADGNWLFRDMYNTMLISVLISVAELVAHLTMAIMLIFEGNSCYRHLNSSTLVDSLISHARFEKKRQIFYGALWCDELAELCACITIAAQELPQSLFSQGFFQVTTFSEFQQYNDRDVMARFAVRFVIQVVTMGTIMHFSQVIFPMDVEMILRRFISRPSLIFYISFVLSYPVSFWIHAQTCDREQPLPLMTLIYTECLRRPVALQGQYVCNRPREGVHFTEPFVRELLNQTGVSPVDLGYNDFAELMTEVDASSSQEKHKHCVPVWTGGDPAWFPPGWSGLCRR